MKKNILPNKYMINVRQLDGTWVFIVPISHLGLTEATNFEFKVEKVTFVSAEKLARRRIRVGIPKRISEYQKEKYYLKDFFKSVNCFATFRLSGKLEAIEEKALEIIREELAILSFSQLLYSKRKQNSSPAISNENPRTDRSYFAINPDRNSTSQRSQIIENMSPLWLDSRWKHFHMESFFFDFLKILRKETSVQKGWLKDLRNAGILAGQSQATKDIPQAFLWNMIALEMLLTQQGDTYRTALPERAEAFIGWAIDWKFNRFEEKIKDIYSKRCAFVHRGLRDLISKDDLIFSDKLLFNIFLNIIKHHQIFTSKEAIISFSKKVQAEHILGVKPKVRPKTLTFFG